MLKPCQSHSVEQVTNQPMERVIMICMHRQQQQQPGTPTGITRQGTAAAELMCSKNSPNNMNEWTKQTRPVAPAAAAIEANRDNRAKCLSCVPLNAKHSMDMPGTRRFCTFVLRFVTYPARTGQDRTGQHRLYLFRWESTRVQFRVVLLLLLLAGAAPHGDWIYFRRTGDW